MDRQGCRSGSTNAGYSSIATQTLAVRTHTVNGDEKVGPDYFVSTLLHEVLHQCLAVATVQPDQDAKAGVEDIEERVVCALEIQLYQTLRENPALIAYLTEGTTNG